ncbi:hypothetical protein EYZ11_005992 [Aspergillus tanneri]|uniref:Uncharacterized protein n=1 Tax=Aspergillus tanneri TaxID=1220188 RepID=A0A4S3JGZ1_9EURO|nr:hypothetical protein EYZ11_005992 [Aspergillus tanneri]
MASDSFNPSSTENPPLSTGTFERTSRGFNITELIQDFLDRERNSSLYKTNLEARIAHECASLQVERQVRSRVEQQLAEMQWAQSQLESTLRHSYEDNDYLQQELALEKKKSQDLESRLATAVSLHETLQKYNLEGKPVQEKSVHEFQLLLQSQTQQEIIKKLQVVNQAHEATINTLQITLKNALGAIPCCCYSDSGDSMVGTPASEERLCPQNLLKDEFLSLSPRIKQSDTWYEE